MWLLLDMVVKPGQRDGGGTPDTRVCESVLKEVGATWAAA